MSGLLFLTSEDFHITKSAKGNIMCTNIPGFSLILFYSTQCEHCQLLIPIFKLLPGNVGGCQFGMINVNQNKSCIIMSKDTIAEIKVVPYIILYINGKPYMRYQGPHVQEEITRFVIEVSEKVQNLSSFTKKEKEKEKQIIPGIKDVIKKEDIPAYTIGKPLFGQEWQHVCYLDFNEAYNNA